ncbi:MAG: (d)CMP kinase [Gemmatimonadetes bacterium]|nr:(d)CMP kinase [Gemmatimonadota bacterium]
MRREGPIVTLDGPAGSGKSTTAREVARRLGFRHLDSGALYRALTYALLQAHRPESTWSTLKVQDLRALGVSLHALEGGFEVRLGGRVLAEELRTTEVTGRVAALAKLPAARACLLELQRQAGATGRLVADGRDMGTVVFPDAEVKVFLVADLRERARRRLRETRAGDAESARHVAEQAEAIAARDEVDSARDVSPLRRPDGAVEIDTTGLSFDEQVARVVAMVQGRGVDAPKAQA